ncbi:hypothetical protein DUP91_26795, partial [Salmonella enterica subsp. enterica]|nr:hypothetical protein [Salmonella enterica subsp. enterica]
ALKPLVAANADEAVAFKRDYEERAAEFADEIEADSPPDLFDKESTATALFSDKAQADAASAKAVAAERRAKSIMQGYTGDMCSNCNSFRMKISGHCQVCEECGTTTGCS